MKTIAMIETLICCGIIYVLSFCFDESQVEMCKHMFLITIASPILYITFGLCHEIYDGWK